MFALNVIIYFHDEMNLKFLKVLCLKMMFQYIWIDVVNNTQHFELSYLKL
jgi:hypothetical protein